MRFDDTLKVKVLSGAGFDIDLNPVTPTETWQELGKCVIFPNNKAATINCNDGEVYQYQFEVVSRLKRDYYSYLPKEGMTIHLHKKDGTIDKDFIVKGFLTLRQRYLKLWV